MEYRYSQVSAEFQSAEASNPIEVEFQLEEAFQELDAFQLEEAFQLDDAFHELDAFHDDDAVTRAVAFAEALADRTRSPFFVHAAEAFFHASIAADAT